MVIKEVRNMLDDNAVVFDNPSFDKSIIGCTEDGAVVYMYDKMVEELMEDDGIDEESAVEFIDYNTIRALPYASGLGVPPVIVYTFN